MTGAGERPAPGARPWIRNVRRLRASPAARERVEVSAPVAGLAISSAEVAPDALVRFEGYLEAAIGGVTVVGRLRAPWTGTCRRCLEPASGELEIELREYCEDATSAREAPEFDDVPYVVGADTLDLEPIVHDACILELPLAPLCAESCRGLCPTCGANLNEGECSCEPPVDERWSALAALSRVEVAKKAARDDHADGDDADGDGDELEQPPLPGRSDPAQGAE